MIIMVSSLLMAAAGGAQTEHSFSLTATTSFPDQADHINRNDGRD